ncbi:hypothetical protein Goshw_008525 [Gossypium schwendimanii]|uniref:Uncharacterized protein n=1 Tax=Gossypium schwendimanii TaxID=34291 RepID=A0A7J9L1S6_GOSSC|nr:hypothetical protein [Gossypium schwendimanii]
MMGLSVYLQNLMLKFV